MPYDSEIIVIGCGNVLFKDDGFGPVIINLLQKYCDDQNDYYDKSHIGDFRFPQPLGGGLSGHTDGGGSNLPGVQVDKRLRRYERVHRGHPAFRVEGGRCRHDIVYYGICLAGVSD